MFYIAHLKKLDWVMITAVFLLVGIGLLSLYSSSLGRGDFSNFTKQLIFFGIGIILMFLLSFVDWRIFREHTYMVLLLYGLCLLALAGLFFLAPITRGVKAWYKIGPVSFDPIEVTKIIVLMILAKYFSSRHVEMYRIRHILLSGAYVFLPVVLIFFQPNLGSAMILIALWVGILMISGIKLKHFLILMFCGMLVATMSWFFLLKDYQKQRIISFANPIDSLGLSWSQNQAKIAVGSGGITGQGILKGSQAQYGFLPEPQTDFIFAAIAEESGLIGVSVVLLLFLVLIYRIMKVAMKSPSNFSRFFAVGLVIMIISQLFIHIGMNLGLLPIIGIPLPLISYGGSGLIAVLGSLGIIQSINNHS